MQTLSIGGCVSVGETKDPQHAQDTGGAYGERTWINTPERLRGRSHRHSERAGGRGEERPRTAINGDDISGGYFLKFEAGGVRRLLARRRWSLRRGISGVEGRYRRSVGWARGGGAISDTFSV